MTRFRNRKANYPGRYHTRPLGPRNSDVAVSNGSMLAPGYGNNARRPINSIRNFMRQARLWTRTPPAVVPGP